MKLRAKEIAFYRRMTDKKWIKKLFFLFAVLVVIIPVTLFFSYFFITQSPENFPTGEVFEIKEGETVNSIAEMLAEKDIIQSVYLFKLVDRYQKIKYPGTSLLHGKYTFKNPLNTFDVYDRLKSGVSGIDPVKITILEGEANFSIAKKMAKKFKNVDEKKFLELAKDHEGYLYPDTYLFSPYSDEQTIIDGMLKNFDNKTAKIIKEVERSSLSLDKIMVMASLVEKEAGSASFKNRKLVAGVLWHRLEIGMPLQVDAVFDYIYQKHIPVKLFSHLEVESPYNTYRNTGFPPTPIANPSVESIAAALNYTKTDYLYYLTGLDGKFYFSKTNKQHLTYKNKYITNYVPEKTLIAKDKEGVTQ